MRWLAVFLFACSGAIAVVAPSMDEDRLRRALEADDHDKALALVMCSTCALLEPGPHPSKHIPPRVWALVEKPRFERLTDGSVTMVAWIGAAPVLYPRRITVVVPPNAGPLSIKDENGNALAGWDPDQTKSVIDAIGSRDPLAARWGIDVAERDRLADAVPALVNALLHADPFVRGAAALALATLGDAAAVQPLIDRLGEETDVHPATMIIRALGRLGDRRAIPMLQRARDLGGAPEVRNEAASVLTDLQ